MTDFELSTTLYGILKDLGAPPSLSGFDYTLYAVKLLYYAADKPEITKIVYPMIAKRFDSTPARVERSLRTFVQAIIYRGDTRTIQRVFGNVYNDRSGSITNKDFLYGLRYELLYRESLLKKGED